MHKYEKRLARLEGVWCAEPPQPPPPQWEPDDAFVRNVLRILYDVGGMPLLCSVLCPYHCTKDVQHCDMFERTLEEWNSNAQI
jgi:hypothetical protein